MLIAVNAVIFMDIILAESVLAKTMKENQVKSKEMIPFYWMIFIVGSCIAVTLSYVSWRKYRGEQNKEQSKDKSVD